MSSLRRRFGFLIVLSAAGYVLSFCGQLLISYHFGTSVELDAYWAGIALVNLMCFYVHPLREALVPAVHRAAQAGEVHAGRMLSAGITLLLMLAVVSSLSIWFLSADFVEVMAPASNEKAADAFLRLLPWLIPYVWMLVLSESFSALLISFDRVVLQAAARLASSLLLIVVVAALGARMGVPALVLAQILGMMVVTSMCVLALRHLRLRLVVDLFRVLREGGLFPLFFSLVGAFLFAQVYVICERSAMIHLSGGLVSAFQYSTALMNVLVSLLAVPLSNLLWPRFLAGDQTRDAQRMGLLAAKAAAILCATLAIACTFIWLNATEVVYVLFGRGAFDAESVARTAEALRAAIFAAVPIGFGAVVGRLLISTSSSSYQIVIGFTTTLAGMSVIGLAVAMGSAHVILWHLLVANTIGSCVTAWIYIRYAGFSVAQLGLAAGWLLRVAGVLLLAAFLVPALDFGETKWRVLMAMLAEGIIFCGITAAAGWACGLAGWIQQALFEKR